MTFDAGKALQFDPAELEALFQAFKTRLGTTRFQLLALKRDAGGFDLLVRAGSPIEPRLLAEIRQELRAKPGREDLELVDCHYLRDSKKGQVFRSAQLIFDSGS
jgi:hypothetical protein